jgi:hypothetical protein
MKSKAFEILQGIHHRFLRGKRCLLLSVIAGCIVLPSARADGIADILTLLKTITGTIQGAIGDALSGMQTLHLTINNFRQRVLWPVAEISQTKSFVNSTRSQYSNLMFQIEAIKNNSATLENPSQLESAFRSGQAGPIRQLQPVYANVYGGVPSPNNARLAQRNMVDMDDAVAEGSLKTTVLSDQTTSQILALADTIEQQSAVAAPGSGPMLATQAVVANLETQAYLAKVLSAELRQEAVKLAHQNALLKQSAKATRNLQNQAQQVLTHP